MYDAIKLESQQCVYSWTDRYPHRDANETKSSDQREINLNFHSNISKCRSIESLLKMLDRKTTCAVMLKTHSASIEGVVKCTREREKIKQHQATEHS